MEVNVNLFAIIVAAVVSMGLGFLWYSPYVLGNQWMKERSFTKDSLKSAQKEMGKLYALSFVVSLITAYVLAHVMTLSEAFYNTPMVQTGLSSGFFMWLGFVMPVQVTSTIFSDKKNWRLFGIDTGYQLASLLVMGVVIGMLS